jgi:hypothetical protein
MTKQLLAMSAITASIICALAVHPEAGQTGATSARASGGRAYTAPKTPWGDPDLQGGYSNKDENGVPFERPGTLAGKQLGEIDDSELAELAQARDANRLEAARGIGGRDTGAGPVHWYEHYGAKNSRAWMVIDPPDGLIPAQTAAAQQRLAGRGGRGGAGGREGGEGGRADSYTDRSFYDRCITRGLPGSMMPAIYGNAYDITQAPGLVAIRYEMIHETRVIRLDDSPRTGISSHMGEARGRWEGNTLVVDDAERPRHVDAAVDVWHDVDRGPRAAAVRVRLPRGELRNAQHLERGARRGGAGRQVGRLAFLPPRRLAPLPAVTRPLDPLQANAAVVRIPVG